MKSETVVIDDKEYIIEYKATELQDIIYHKPTQQTFIAGLSDIDDMNWIITEQVNYSNIEQ